MTALGRGADRLPAGRLPSAVRGDPRPGVRRRWRADAAHAFALDLDQDNDDQCNGDDNLNEIEIQTHCFYPLLESGRIIASDEALGKFTALFHERGLQRLPRHSEIVI